MSSGVLVSTLPIRPPPQALFTRMSMVPQVSTAVATMASTWSLFATSVGQNSASSPSESATAFPVASFFSATSTLAPSATKWLAIPFPMPSPAPVMIAIRPSSRPIVFLSPRAFPAPCADWISCEGSRASDQHQLDRYRKRSAGGESVRLVVTTVRFP